MMVLASAAASVDALTPAADEPAAEPQLLLIPWEYGTFADLAPTTPFSPFQRSIAARSGSAATLKTKTGCATF